MSLIGAFAVPHPPMIIPEVGKGREKDIEKTINSYKTVAKEIRRLEPDTIIISSPHTTIYSDYLQISKENTATGSFKDFGADNVKFNVEYDKELINEIEKIGKKYQFPIGTEGKNILELDHGTMVPLYFINQEYNDYKLIRIGLSGLPQIDHYKAGMIIKEAIENSNKRVVYVASGDLSHKLQEYGPYGYIEEGPIYDKRIIKTLETANFNELLEYDENFLEKAAECGHRSFIMMAGTIDKQDVEAKFLSHEDITGVGYGIWMFYPKERNDERNFLDKYLENEKKKIISSDEYVNLARKTIEEYIRNNTILDIPNNINKDLLENKAGVFVSIHKFNRLRGCIGTILPTTECIAKEIINNAISASTNDYRFDQIKVEELPYLEINVDVLTPPEKITSKEELDVKKYGVIVTKGNKRGLLLPDLEGIDTVDNQIETAKRKADIPSYEEVELERFEVIRHK